MNYKEKYQLWLDNLQEGDPLREELIDIRDNVMEIKGIVAIRQGGREMFCNN